jgi:hypothetical protein
LAVGLKNKKKFMLFAFFEIAFSLGYSWCEMKLKAKGEQLRD